ncbi:Ctr copper transporter family protein [Dictyocaulus viviparus]|uniref:Copper transport protein n=1 Tax=Dictyocaulus viviparus TaxID=29172 RepID=A0A0D8XGV9_DICVI|nr:Ctr copper transporter family protein [Dictyocaulus viviparus]
MAGMTSSVLGDIDSFMQEMENESKAHPRSQHSAYDDHDHSLHNLATHNNHTNHQMKMWFHGGWNEVILFESWSIDSLSGLILSFIAIFAMGAIYEEKMESVFGRLQVIKLHCKTMLTETIRMTTFIIQQQPHL